MKQVDIIIIGAGAAGLICAIEAGKRGRQVLVLDHANKPGKKILMSGGGRCNFTNLYIDPENYSSHNPHFCKSSLGRYTQWDFIELVKKHNIPFHEKTLGQLFCDNKSQDILNMILLECERNGVSLQLNTVVENIERKDNHRFILKTSRGANTGVLGGKYGGALGETFECESLVIASGGLSIPTMGASPFGYKVAAQFGIKVWPTRAGLVPLTLHPADKEKLSPLSGVSVESLVCTKDVNKEICFSENILFTHRGISGPAILQISSYWQPGQELHINLIPTLNLAEHLKVLKQEQPQKQLKTILNDFLAKRLVEVFLDSEVAPKSLQALSFQEIQKVAEKFNRWSIKPNGTEGYRTAEVTLGGVDCHAISSKTMEANEVPGLYFIGEVLDVSGWLGGFNFQWAWSSGWAAGQVV